MRTRDLALIGLITFGSATLAYAQPPRPGGQGGRGDGPHGPDGRPPGNPFLEVLDINGDHVIDAEEINAAAKSLLKLDKNGDGKLSDEEIRPPMSPPNDRERNQEQMRGDGPPRDGGPRDGGPRDGGPRDGGPRDGGPRNEGPRDGNVGQGPQDPGRFVDHAMQFDANKDGLLSRDELMKFAKQMPGHRPDGDHAGPDDRGPDRRGSDRPRRPATDQ